MSVCSKIVWHRFGKFSCSATGKYEHDGKLYCKKHHPPSVEATRKAKAEKWERECAARHKAREDANAKQAEIERKAAAYDELSPGLAQLLEAVRNHQWTEAERRAQAISFAYGNCAIENTAVTREVVEQEYDKLHPEEGWR